MTGKPNMRILERRNQLKLSQEALAELVGTSQKQVSRYERGEQSPTADVLIAFSQALDTTVDYLLGLTDNPERPLRGEYDLDDVEREAVMILRSKPIRERKKLVDVWRVLS